MNMLLRTLLFSQVIVDGVEMPAEPQGPAFARKPNSLKYDLLRYKHATADSKGAFVPKKWPKGHVNNELQQYEPEAVVQDSNSKEITITAQKQDKKVTSGRLETHGVWSTSTSEDTKMRGYIEVRALIPAKTDHSKLQGAWPAIWMLGRDDATWPKRGEIDILESVNGIPDLFMTLHSTRHHGSGGVHPPNNPFKADADFTHVPGIFGFEWNINDHQIDLTWWTTYYDMTQKKWIKKDPTTKVLQQSDSNKNDFYDFYDSFKGKGFSLIVNLAEGGDWPGQHNEKDVLIDDKPQHVVIKSAKVYRPNARLRI